MKWTARDTTYLTVIFLLVAWLGFFINEMTDHAAPEVEIAPVQAVPQSLEGVDAGISESYVEIGGYQVTKEQMENPEPVVQQIRIFDIDRNATHEEIASELGVKMENLPPSLRKRPDATDEPQPNESGYE